MHLGMLGPFEVSVRGRVLPLRGGRQRALLAMLALHTNQVVSQGRLIDELWPEEPFASAVNALHVTVSRTRKILQDATGEPPLITKPPGYALSLGDGELDTLELERLWAEGREALAIDDPSMALDRFRAGEALWRGPALSDFAYEPFAQQEIARLEELKLLAIEERIHAELLLGGAGGLTAELEALVATHPLRERLRVQLMLSLYRSGRQVEALAVFDRAREFLRDELGLDPGPELVQLHLAVLRQDPQLAAQRLTRSATPVPRGASVGVQLREGRKTVTALAAMVTHVDGETLDTEALGGVRALTFEKVDEVLRQFGARVQPPLGDTLVATFGLPLTHEDDLLRALRAAVALRAAMSALTHDLQRERDSTVSLRIGLDTGEVVVGGELPLAAGAPVASAVRLAMVAGDGEVLIGDETYRLGAHAIRSAPTADGTWRLLEVEPGVGAIPRRHDAFFVGRDVELLRLQDAFERAVTARSVRVVHVIGEAGIGKTRLTQEFASRLEEQAQVLTARCLSYGEDVAFAPLRELIRQAAEGRTVAHIRELLPDDLADAVARDVAAALGTQEGSTALDPSWALRKLLEAIARRRPLVVVIDDIHWAQPPLVELIESVADHTDGAPILLICAARPELLDTALPSATNPGHRVVLLPLTDDETQILVDRLPRREPLAPGVRSRIVETAEGNPLFVEQLLAFHSGSVAGHDEVLLPPTIQALLAARLDRLGPGERGCLDAGAVIGKEFWLGAVLELVPQAAGSTVRRHLRSLVDEQLVSPVSSTESEDEVFRFAHVLIQETTYRTIPKARRVALHESLGRWLELTPSASEEMIGFHLERAYRYRLELGSTDEDAHATRAGAAKHLATAGHAAFVRSDAGAAQRLLTRAVELLDQSDPLRLELSVRIAEASVERGDLELANTLTSEVLADPRTSPMLAAHAALTRLRMEIENAEVEEGQIATDLAGPMALFESEGDEIGLAYR
jgi:DNA-binding SARP family transcriptional activator